MKGRTSLFYLTVISLVTVAAGDVGSWTVGTSLPSTVLQVAVHPEPIGPFLEAKSGALPTNQFWTNFILGDGSAPVAPLPYVLSATSDGLAVSYPVLTSEMDSISATHTPDFIIGSKEPLDIHHVTKYTELSVQLEQRPVEGSGSLVFPIVRGSPYLTTQYTGGLTPRLYSATPVRDINGMATSAQGNVITESRFLLGLEDDTQWVLYLSHHATIMLTDDDDMTIQFLEPFDGVMRLAFVPSTEVLAMLDQHRAVYPTSAAVSYTVADLSGTYVFSWATETFGASDAASNSTDEGADDSELFMLALPHQYDTIMRPSFDTAPVTFTSFHSLKGDMREVFGSEWELHETLPDYQWFMQRNPEDFYLPALKDALSADTARLSANSTNPYWLGRELSSIARLALIADLLQEDATAKKCRDFIAEKLTFALNSLAVDALLYETDWGGIITRNSLYSPLSDGGLCWYNNHLSQYGSLIFAAAVVSKANPAWANSETATTLELLVRDLINPSSADTAFPVTRHKDCWGLGLQHTPQGKSIDSVQEAAHAYYAVHLWGKTNGKQEVADLASLLVATELRAARRYWQMTALRSVYDPVFSANKFVDQYASLAVSASEENLMQALARQIIPLSPLLSFTIYRPTVQDTYAMIHNSLLRNGDLSSALRAYGWVALSQIEPGRAFFNLAALPAFNYGETRTNMLYFAATRLPFDNSTLPAAPSLDPIYSRSFLMSVDFAPDQTSAVNSPFFVDTGALYSDDKSYGWLKGSKPTGATAPLSPAFNTHFGTYIRFDSSSRWKADVPEPGDYFVRIATVPSEGECGELVVLTQRDNLLLETIDACPIAGEAVRVWSGVVSLPYPEFVLSSRSSTNIAYLEISSASGSYLDITFSPNVEKRDAIGILTPPDRFLLRRALAAVTAQPEERFHVHWVSDLRASVLVLDSSNYPGTAASYDVASSAVRAPLPMWAKQGVSVSSVLVSSAPNSPDTPPTERKTRHNVPVVIIVLTALIGAAFVIGSVVAVVVLLRKRSKAAQPYVQEFGVVPTGSTSSLTGNRSANTSQVDLLQQRTTISPTNSANALASAATPSPPTAERATPNP